LQHFLQNNQPKRKVSLGSTDTQSYLQQVTPHWNAAVKNVYWPTY